MATVNLDDAKAHLREIISGLNPGEQLMIVQEGEPVATLTRSSQAVALCRWQCKRYQTLDGSPTSMLRSKTSGSTPNHEPAARHARDAVVLLGMILS